MASDPLASTNIVLVTETCRDPALDVGGCECVGEKHDDRGACPLWREGMDFSRYLETQDETLIKCLDGRQPVRFQLVQLKGSFLLNEIDTLRYPSQKQAMAFRSACHSIEIPGGPAMAVADDEWISKKAPKVASNAWLDRVVMRFGSESVVEAGQIAMNRVRLRKDDSSPLA
jgi:hypothetical protein